MVGMYSIEDMEEAFRTGSGWASFLGGECCGCAGPSLAEEDRAVTAFTEDVLSGAWRDNLRQAAMAALAEKAFLAPDLTPEEQKLHGFIAAAYSKVSTTTE